MTTPADKKKGFWAQVILDSIGPQGNRLTTMEFTIPKLWLAEFNTHCMFARNSASTRAIPFKRQVQMMEDDTFVPQEWPLENPGMSAINNLETPHDIARVTDMWISAMQASRSWANNLARYGIHKQLAGRLLEPWRYQTVLVTGDEASYSNFFCLRLAPGAAPEIRASANKMYEAYKASTPTMLRAGEWHTPLITHKDLEDTSCFFPMDRTEMLRRVSTARCARLSYLNHHGLRDIAEDKNLFSKLTSNGHWSPLEHVCRALPVPGVLRSWALRKLNAAEKGHGKWAGWHQFRKDFPREYVTEYLKEVTID